MIYADQREPSLKSVREFTALAVSPLVWVAALPHGAVQSGTSVKTRETLERENVALREQQLFLELKLQKLAALEAENYRIRELLSSTQSLHDRVLIAEIIAVSQDPYRHQITLNKGSNDKVYRGQALVDAKGIMGQVVKVGPNTSQALLITDPDHGIPVEINRTGLQTIAVGLGDGQGLKLPFLPSNADIKVGDLLVSSPLGGRFPAGYPVGKIYNVKNLAGEHFMEAVAYPSAKLNQGRQALLVWSEYKAGVAPPVLPAPVPVPAPTPAVVTPPAASTNAPVTATAAVPPTAPAVTARPAAPAVTTAPKPVAAAPKPIAATATPAAIPKPASATTTSNANTKPVIAPIAPAKPTPAAKPASATTHNADEATSDHAKPSATPEPTPTSP